MLALECFDAFLKCFAVVLRLPHACLHVLDLQQALPNDVEVCVEGLGGQRSTSMLSVKLIESFRVMEEASSVTDINFIERAPGISSHEQ